MSLIPSGTTIIQAAAASLLPLVYIRPRSIGGIVANVTIEERAVDELAITDHPVEQGAAITDHAYKRPAAVSIIAAWSNSAYQGLGNPNYIQEIYDALLELQASREPFDIVTGKRFYQNMLMQRLFNPTDEKSEYSLFTVCECREIILVSTQSVVVPPAAKMKSPEANAATVKKGTISIRPSGSANFQ